MNTRASIITIGDELLIGQVIDTNSAWIAQQLNSFGIDVVRRVAVGDTRDAILQSLDEELLRNELIIITGGLGPTADDITKPLLAEYFGGKLIVNKEVLEHVKGFFERRKRPFLESNMKQAEVPDVCTVLFNTMGTAPGMWFERGGKVVISLPGVPFEMVNIMETVALPKLRERFTSDAIVHRSIITAGEGESFVADRIKDLEAALPAHIKLAYLPSYGMVRLRLTGHGKDEQQLMKEVAIHQESIANRLDDIVVSLEDLALEHILGKALATKEWTIGLAESCTGGCIGHRITQIMGSGQYFNGSLVCYQDFVKEELLGVNNKTIQEHSVVSAEVALEMAEGTRKRLKSDIGFGVTGYLSEGGEDDRVPVGTVWIAVTDGKNKECKSFHFHADRLRNKEMAVNMSLLFIWKFVRGKL